MKEATPDQPLYTPIFHNAVCEAFLPYEEWMFETKTEAKRFAKEMQLAVYRQISLINTGRVLRITGEIKYPTVAVPLSGVNQEGEEEPTCSVALIKGVLYDAAIKEREMVSDNTITEFSDFTEEDFEKIKVRLNAVLPH